MNHLLFKVLHKHGSASDTKDIQNVLHLYNIEGKYVAWFVRRAPQHTNTILTFRFTSKVRLRSRER